jgi:hypothetical protein
MGGSQEGGVQGLFLDRDGRIGTEREGVVVAVAALLVGRQGRRGDGRCRWRMLLGQWRECAALMAVSVRDYEPRLCCLLASSWQFPNRTK